MAPSNTSMHATAITRRSTPFSVQRKTQYQNWLSRINRPATRATTVEEPPEIVPEDLFYLLRQYEQRLNVLADFHAISDKEILNFKASGAQALSRLGQDTASNFYNFYQAYESLQNVQFEKANENCDMFMRAD